MFYIQVIEDKRGTLDQAKFNDKSQKVERQKITANKHQYQISIWNNF